MTLLKVHKITVQTRHPGPLTGANCEVLLDGVPLKGVKSVTFHVEAGSVGTIRLDMIADVEMKDAGLVYEIGNYEPVSDPKP